MLIFERLREEQHAGKSLRMALRDAYGHALSAILDSNATTVVTSLFLYMFGSEEVKGFGLTLLPAPDRAPARYRSNYMVTGPDFAVRRRFIANCGRFNGYYVQRLFVWWPSIGSADV